MDLGKKLERREKAKQFVKSSPVNPVPKSKRTEKETPVKSKDSQKKQANYLLDDQLKMDIQIEATRQGVYPAQLVGKVMREYLEEKGKKGEEP